MKQGLAYLFLVVALFAVTACGAGPSASPAPSASNAQPAPKAPLSPPPGTLPIEYKELSTRLGPAPSADVVPWTLIRTDPDQNRIYISATQNGCTAPDSVYLKETADEVRIEVTSPKATADHCTEQKATLIGYVQLKKPLDGRRVTGGEQR